MKKYSSHNSQVEKNNLLSGLFSCFFALFFTLNCGAADKKMKMNFNNEDIGKVIEEYAKASDQNFIIDPQVRGKISIFNENSIEISEAYNQLSSSLAVLGYAISKQENSYIVTPARMTQRTLIEVTTTVPALKPERMVTWVVNLKHISAKTVVRELRSLVSRDGDISWSSLGNQIVITDWTSNLVKLSSLFQELDKPADPQTKRFLEQNKKSDKSE